MLEIPAYQYKLKVICIDDNNVYLNALSHELSKKFVVEKFSDPILALNHINSYDDVSPEFLESVRDLENNRILTDLKIEQISKLASTPKTEIGVVIVDHNMPGMSGIELCKKIPRSICKILLTGYNNANEAIDCFNNNIIDYYYLKDSPNIIEELKEVIDNTFHQYFMKKSQYIYNILNNKQFALKSSKICQTILKIIKEKSDNEFYLIDKNGSFMFIKDQIKNYIIVHNDASINEFLDNYQEVKFIEPIISSIKQRKKIPTFLNILPEHVPYNEWKNYIVPCQTISDTNNYYLAVVYG